MAAYRLWAGFPLQHLQRATTDRQLGLQLTDTLSRGREVTTLSGAQPRLQTAVDAVLAALVVDRLVTDLKVLSDARDAAPRSEQVQDLAPELS